MAKDSPQEPILRFIDQLESDEERVFNISLRPQSFKEFIGQRHIIDNLEIAIEACKRRGEVLEHTLLSGPPGLGKTCLAYIISRQMGTKLTSTSGPAIERAGDLIGILTNLERGDILFIDEIHRLSRVVEEFLYPAMENYQIDFVIDKGPYAKTIKFNLKPFTLIGATTREGLLSAPLRSRFGLFYHFQFYTPDELSSIIRRSAKLLGVEITPEACLEIAHRSRGTPRVANRLLRRVRDYAQVKYEGNITPKVVMGALQSLGIDSQGLDELDRKFLRAVITIHRGGPVGIEAIAASLNEDPETLQDVVEPYLLKKGFLVRSPRGRMATGLAFKHLGFKAPDSSTQDSLFKDV